MLGFLKRNQGTASEPVDKINQVEENADKPRGFFARLKSGLQKTKQAITGGIADTLLGKKVIDNETLEEIELYLLSADVGVEATQSLIASLTERLNRKALKDGAAVMQALQEDMQAMLLPCEVPLDLPKGDGPKVILMVGINGAGKTTTIGKLAKQFAKQGKSVLLAAGDTFRAAAVEQLKTWGERNDIPVIAQHAGADSAAVIFDAVTAAKARNIDIVLADTAGRLHTQSHLMDELKKVKRVITKCDETAPHEILLVLDASIGQNALVQAKEFNKAVGISGICLTKLDGTAKGGIIFAIAKSLKTPIRFIGVGEGIDDLKPFAAKPFVQALFD